MKFRLNRQFFAVIVCLSAALVLFSGAALALHAWEEGQTRDTPPPTGGEGAAGPDAGAVQFGGDWYAPRKGLQTTLLIGVDKYLTEELSQGVQGEFEQADFLMLLVVDPEAGRCDALHINRDTMVDYPVISNAGRRLTTVNGQITLAHTYGGSAKLRCQNTVETVEGLLPGIEIDHYIELGMDGIVLLNDMAGGVTVEVLDDFSEIDPSLVKGETVTLHGEQALTYVRVRKGLEDPSNLHRMERQQQYLNALQEQLFAISGQDSGFVGSTLLKVNEYLVSDCTVEQLSALAESLQACGPAAYHTLEGESAVEDGHAAFYVDGAALETLLIELFYEPQR